jgi:HEAT repeat protein
MKWMFLFALPLVASDPATERMLNTKLTSAQRNDACFALRGDSSPGSIDANARALHDTKVRSCAQENLRRANAIDALKGAASDDDPEVRAVAARVLGTFERPELAPIIAKAGEDSQMLVATNAIEGLSYYRDNSANPYLLKLAKRTGIVGSLAIERLIKLNEPKTLILGRELIKSLEPADLLAAMRILGSMGESSDIPALEAVAKSHGDALSTSSGRGFGLMPTISLDRAAKSSIEQIRNRH